MLGPNIGEIRWRIAFLRDTGNSTNGVNDVLPNWTIIANSWASFMPISDGERLANGGISSNLMGRFQIRYSALTSSLTPKDRLQMDGLIYDIIGIKQIAYRQWLEITAATRTDGG